MPVSTTDLVAEVRTVSDLQASRFLTDPEILILVNESAASLYDKLVIEREGYFQTRAPLTLDGTNTATLPADFFKEISLEAGTGASAYPIFALETYNDRLNLCDGPRYWLSARTLSIYPQNVAPSGPVTLTYVPDITVFTDGQNIPTDMERFREWIVVDAAIKVKTKRQKSTAELEKRLQRLDVRVMKMVTNRKAAPKVPAIPRQDQSGRYGGIARYGFPYWR